jgi:hypothetical protein
MGVRRAKESGVQRSGMRAQVVRVAPGTGQKCRIFLPFKGLPDPRGRFD